MQKLMPAVNPSRDSSLLRFARIPIVEGPLSSLEEIRSHVMAEVVSKTVQDMSSNPTLDLLLGEALYSERYRVKRAKTNVFTLGRVKRDVALLNAIQGGLLHSAAEVDRKSLLEKMVQHYVNEITGHFDPRVYWLVVRAVPWLFNWLLNAASVRRFLPWGMTQSLESRLHVLGEVPMLQKLAQRGTILLVPTHQSNIDSMLIGYVISLMSLPPFSYGAGLNLFSNPLFSFGMGHLGAYTVDRQKTNEIYKCALKNYSTRILREGVHSIFFPGGGRIRSGALESKLKLGLLGTALDAQIEGLRIGSPRPNVYIVPMVTSYHFVLEAGSLIEDYLADAGKHRYILMDDDSWRPAKIISFFWKLFSSKSSITVRIGKPLDVFGNFVDEEGRSIGPNGTTIDPKRWLSTCGELKSDPQRDREYTRALGARIVERFHKDNTVLTSHLVAFAFFETLRKKYPDLDLYRFLRLSLAQRSMPFAEFLASVGRYHERLKIGAERGEFYLSQELATLDVEACVNDGLKQLGLLHDAAVVKVKDGATWTEDMNLLYYYRNRLAGYGLSLLAESGGWKLKPGQNDEKGFLA